MWIYNMGKKKASRSPKLRSLLEQAIRRGDVFCSDVEIKYFSHTFGVTCEFDHYSYNITFLADDNWWNKDVIAVHAAVDKSNGKVSYTFIDKKHDILDRTTDAWFTNVLGEIITMYRLGAYKSKRDAQGPWS